MIDWISRRRFIGTSAACAAFAPFSAAAAKAQKQPAAKGKSSAEVSKKRPAKKGVTAAEARAL